MSIDRFIRLIEIILKNEGGYVNNPYDPGGETNYGICKRQYPELDIKNLTKGEAIEIYFRDYWHDMNLSGIKDDNLVLQIFDMGVNAGPKTAIKIIQKLIGAKVDGICGPQTTGLVNKSKLNLMDLYKAERKKYYFSLARNPNKEVFLAGWLNRVDNTYIA